MLAPEPETTAGAPTRNAVFAPSRLRPIRAIRTLMRSCASVSFDKPPRADDVSWCSAQPTYAYSAALESNLRLNEQYTSFPPSDANCFGATCTEERVRRIPDKPGLAPADAVGRANVCMSSTWPLVARFNAVPANSSERRPKIPRTPTATRQSSETAETAQKHSARPARGASRKVRR